MSETYPPECLAEIDALEAKWGIELMSMEQHESLMREVIVRANLALLEAGSTTRLMVGA